MPVEIARAMMPPAEDPMMLLMGMSLPSWNCLMAL